MKDYLNNREKEMQYYQESANFGNKMAMHNIGLDYGKKGDYKIAEMWFRKAGHNSMVCYMYKEIVKDKEKALECYIEEAKNDETKSILSLGYTYLEYDNYEKMLEQYKRASSLGSSSATYSIGTYYKYAGKDKEKMIFWYKKAASMGNLKAIKFLNKKGKL